MSFGVDLKDTRERENLMNSGNFVPKMWGSRSKPVFPGSVSRLDGEQTLIQRVQFRRCTKRQL